MKTLFIFCLCLISFLSFGQVVDSTVLRQVDSLIAVTRQLIMEQKFDEAMQVGEAAQKMAEGTFGKESAAYASCLFNRGRVCYAARRYGEALPFYVEAKAIREKVLTKEHPDYLRSVLYVAYVYHYTGRYKEAERLYFEAKEIEGKVSGKQSGDYASVLQNLAILYTNMGQYENAEPIYQEAMAIWGNLDKNAPNYSRGLNNLGVLYFYMGRYEDAEPLYLEAIAIKGKILGKETREYATSLNNLAELYAVTGRYKEAESLHLDVLQRREKILSEEDPDYTQSLNNLANLYDITGRYKDAESMYTKAKDIRQKAGTTESPDYAAVLTNLANVYFNTERYEKADTLYLESKNIRERLLGPRHPDYAESLTNLGNLYIQTGRFADADTLLRQAKAIREETLGDKHPDYVRSLISLANLYFKKGDYKEAGSFYQQANTVTNTRLSNSSRSLSDRELSAYVQLFTKDLDHYYSFAQITNEAFPDYSASSYDNALFHKGFLLNATSRISNLSASDTTATRLNELLKSYHRRLAIEIVKPIAEREGVEDLEAQANATEKELVRTVTGFSEAIRQASWQEVQAALKPGEAAIEFIHYRLFAPSATDSVLYTALVTRPGDAIPWMVPLFEERQLTELLPKSNDVDRIDEFYKAPMGKSVYARIWQPLNQLLEGVTTVYCSPSGLLHRLNLGAIPFSVTQTFADRHRLVVLGSTRQLVTQQVDKLAANTAVLFGGIQYDSDPTLTEQDTIPLFANSQVVAGTSDIPFPYDMATRGSDAKPWKPLLATASEVQAIAALLQKQGFAIQLKTGAAATEEAFKQLGRLAPSPRILHLSTHGYFFADPKDASAANRALGKAEPVFKLSDNPMIRSGLILAGANIAWTTGHPPEQGEDGILTAYEISQQNLSNTELVVLSACETGLGQIDGNEGVYGLQRAFKIAGVKYLIMSLWKVSDQATEELMTEFYRFYLDRKLPVQDAFRGAQQSMRAKYPGSPYVWAGFVLVE